jgi:signal transduction histidine kinase
MNIIIGDRTKNKGDYCVSHVFKVKLKPRSNRIVWIKLKKIISFFDFSYEIGNRQELEKGSTKNLIFNSVFIGLISMLILLNLILFIITKIKTYLSYVIYSFLTIVYLAITTGFAKFYALPEFIWVSEVRVYSGVFWIILLIHFYKELIEVKAFSRSIHLWINGLSIFNISHVAFVFFIPKMEYFIIVQFFWKLGYLIFLAQAVLIFYVVIKKFNAKSKISIYIMLSFIPHICWFIIYILRAFHVILHEVNYEWLMIIALYEAILFGFVLAYNYVNTMQSNNELNLKVITLKQESIDLISMTQIKERRQVSNLIHDKFGSQLAYIKNLINTDNTNLVKEKINELSSEIRNVSHQILPKSLDEGRLCASIGNQIQILNETDINCQFSFHSFDFPEVILENWRYDLYLISLEIINNAIKHGNPKEVSVEFYSYDDRYVFQYTDDGLGFDSTNFQKGFGLNSIESRIKNANGIFEINSKLGEGVVVQITFCI